ncbi:MAG: acetate--CoA ligase family protein [Gammaproteobacteria bacterium]|nr:acetate--CoA ligase family protein [Gammaproteobacteria bacterium]
MTSAFIPEHEVYGFLSAVGIKTPRYFYADHESKIADAPFENGDPVVVKGTARDLWHKSDNGALTFCDFDSEAVAAMHGKMRERIGEQFEWLGTLIAERVEFQPARHTPCEVFVSLQRDQCCGAIISFGFGGLLTEDWARELKQSLLVWPATAYTPEEAFEELRQHWLGKILLGEARQQEPLTNSETLLGFLEKLWKLDELMAREQLGLLEMNPVIIDKAGDFVALDGVGLRATEAHEETYPVPLQDDSFLHPRRIALAGVSAKAGSVGGLILENLRQASLPEDGLLVIKPGVDEFAGVRCVPDVAALVDEPVDILIVALPATQCVPMIEQLCAQGGGAAIVYIVAGGIGDGADKSGFGNRLSGLIESRRQKGQWCPAIVGPNGLGMLLSPLQLNSLFIPQSKLNVEFAPESDVALISQSGAFLITRLSRHSNLDLKYGFSIGNQLDMKLSDFMALVSRDKSVRVLGIYVEGFVGGDACAVAKLVEEFRAENRHVIIYKGGRSRLGQSAAESHTGAMTGDYHVQKRLLHKAGAILTESFNQFNAVLKWMAAYPDLRTLGKLAIVTNAGYETVGSVDTLGDNDSERLYKLTENDRAALGDVLECHGMQGLVAASNPLDLTPMADEDVYFDCVRAMIEFGAGVVMLGLVPLSEQLDTDQLTQAEAFAARLKSLAESKGRLVGIVIDAGVPYQRYKAVFERAGFPVFDGMDMGVLGINVLKNSR